MKRIRPDLVLAAEGLESELDTFVRIATEASSTPLDSRKNIERGTRLLTDLAAEEARLDQALGALVRAIDANRARQQAAVDAVQAWALELQTRSGLYAELVDAFEALGPEIAPVMEALKAVVPGDIAGARAVRDQILVAAERAGNTRLDAEEKGFKDIARLALSRQDQLVALAMKLSRAVDG